MTALTGFTPDGVVDLLDMTYLSNAPTRDEAPDILRAGKGRVARRESDLNGDPTHTTGPELLGYSDEKVERLTEAAVSEGFTQIKPKVGSDIHKDKRRLAVARAALGPDICIAVAANQRWDFDEDRVTTAPLLLLQR